MRPASALVPARPSAEIVRVEALSLWRCANSSWSRRTISGDRACRSALAVAPCSSRNGLWKLSRGLRGFDSPVVRGSSGLKIAAFKYKRSTRSVLLQLRLENRNTRKDASLWSGRRRTRPRAPPRRAGNPHQRGPALWPGETAPANLLGQHSLHNTKQGVKTWPASIT